MTKTTDTTSYPPAIELALGRLHNNLRFLEVGLPDDLIASSQALLDRSLAELGIDEPALWRIYPRFRFERLCREAREYLDGAFDVHDADIDYAEEHAEDDRTEGDSHV